MIYRYQPPSLTSLTPSWHEVHKYLQQMESCNPPMLMEESRFELSSEQTTPLWKLALAFADKYVI